MLIRFIAKNVLSFNEQTEFNLLPGRTKNLEYHIRSENNIDFLRMSAIYGANGAGKSNFFNLVSYLQELVRGGSLKKNLPPPYFLLSKKNAHQPSSIAIEFLAEGASYYYVISFTRFKIEYESLIKINKGVEKTLYERSYDGNNHKVDFYHEFVKDDKNKLFVEVLKEKIIKEDDILLYSLGTKFKEELPDFQVPFNWITKNLVVIHTGANFWGGVAHILEDKTLKEFADNFISRLDTGIQSIEIRRRIYDDKEYTDEILNSLKDFEGVHFPHPKDPAASLILENQKIIEKKIISKHRDEDGEFVNFPIGLESDGTKRLIDYIPAFEDILNDDCVYLIDEIERSIHPLLIKEIITQISHNKNMKGQLIFSTHESSLLDNKILRKDEIWFAQKSPTDGSTKLYSLNDFKTHHSISIENGYLDGRYGGIPFLSNLKDLNWEIDETFNRPNWYSKVELDKDARKIYVFTEGSVKEPSYFEFFRSICSNIDIKIIPSTDGKSDPVKLLESCSALFSNNTTEAPSQLHLSKDYKDEVWFIIDTDDWKTKISNLREYCRLQNLKLKFNCFAVAESNPSFEIWLYYHYNNTKPSIVMTAGELKKHLHETIVGGVDCRKLGKKVLTAINNSEIIYQSVENNDYYYTTEVYVLAKKIYEFVKHLFEETPLD